MKLGPCPICKNDLSIYKSLDIDGFKRYDYKCNTKGCMINLLEWNYEDKQILIKAYNRSVELSKHKCKCEKPIIKSAKDLVIKYDIAKPVKRSQSKSIHYTESGKRKDIICSSRSVAKSFTNTKSDVTCSRCKSNKSF